MASPRILVVDDKASARALVRRVLEPEGYEVLEAGGVAEAISVQAAGALDVVLTDLRMPDADGICGIRQLRAVDPELPIVMLTAYATVDTALEAMKSGAFDYLQKPIDPAQLTYAIDRALGHKRLLDENRRLREKLTGVRSETRLITRAPAMIELLALTERVAQTDLTVLVEGESGTGKELVARRVHLLSRRSAQVFLSINCSAIPENLLESELFGYEQGAFSGAEQARPGFFAEAEGGTLMLDEIGDMSTALQPKLLRVLQEAEFYPVGRRSPRRCDVRIICCTHRNLPELVEEGGFREDLYYRIDHARLRIPPLRERLEDIPILAKHFLAAARQSFDTAAVRIGAAAMEQLVAYHWPGNVRQLSAVIERACLTAAAAELGPDDLPPEVRGGAGTPAQTGELDYRRAREAFEAAYLERLMTASNGQVAEAAKRSNLHRATLYEKLTRHGIKT